MNAADSPARAEIVVDLGAIRANVRRLREVVSTSLDHRGESLDHRGESLDGPQLMVVVKADAYGHGMVEVGRAAREAGAEWLGVATLDEALELRRAGDAGSLLCWIVVPGEDYGRAVAEGVDITAHSVAQLSEIVVAGSRLRSTDAGADGSTGAGADGSTAAGVDGSTGLVPRVQLKFDTGLSRGGAPRSEWQALIDAAARAERDGLAQITGVWSHFACSDEPEHPANDAQEDAFREALALVEGAGLRPEVRHLANSAAAILRPSSRFDLVRMGISSYGLSPAPEVVTSAELGLVPAMTVRGRLVIGKDLAAGEGVSYGHTFVTDRPTHVALVPLGYGDGVPRHASSRAEVSIRGARARVLGRICMDQFVVESDQAEAGDEVVLFGPGDHGEPTAQDWAQWCATISYEIVTRMRGRQTRTWVGA